MLTDNEIMISEEDFYYEIISGKNFIKVFWNFKLLPSSFIAITLFGAIFSNLNKKDLLNYLLSKRGRKTMNHERIHILQANSFKTKYLGFYTYYLYYWVKNLFKYKFNNDSAYRNIPFEKEVFANDNNYEYYETNWKKYI